MASKTWIESHTPSALPPGVAAVMGGVACQLKRVLFSDHRQVTQWDSLTFLQENHAGESIVQVPKVYAAHTTLVVQISVHVKRLIGLDLHLADPLAGDRALTGALATTSADAADAAFVQRRVELVAPWGAVAVAVAVVVAEEVVAARLLAALDGQGLVDGREKVLRQIRCEGNDCIQVVGRVFRVQAAEEVARRRDTRQRLEMICFDA